MFLPISFSEMFLALQTIYLAWPCQISSTLGPPPQSVQSAHHALQSGFSSAELPAQPNPPQPHLQARTPNADPSGSGAHPSTQEAPQHATLRAGGSIASWIEAAPEIHRQLAKIDASLAALILGLLSWDPARRLTAHDALRCRFFGGGASGCCALAAQTAPPPPAGRDPSGGGAVPVRPTPLRPVAGSGAAAGLGVAECRRAAEAPPPTVATVPAAERHGMGGSVAAVGVQERTPEGCAAEASGSFDRVTSGVPQPSPQANAAGNSQTTEVLDLSRHWIWLIVGLLDYFHAIWQS